jgi:hypothetical protein
MTTFDNANLEDFNSIFRFSQFLQFIDNSDPAILSTIADVFCYKEVTIEEGTSSYTIDFKFQLEDTVQTDFITSDSFIIGGSSYSLRTIDSGTSDPNLKYIVIQDTVGNRYTTVTGTDQTFGEVDLQTGLLTLGSPTPTHTAFPTDISPNTIKIFSRPSSDDVVAKRNTVIQIDTDQSTVQALLDNIALSGNAGIKNYRTINRT